MPPPADNLPILQGFQEAELCCHTVSSIKCHGAWTSGPDMADLFTEWKCTASQNMTHLHLLQNDSSVHLLTTLKCGGLGGSLVDGRVDGEHYATLYFHL